MSEETCGHGDSEETGVPGLFYCRYCGTEYMTEKAADIASRNRAAARARRAITHPETVLDASSDPQNPFGLVYLAGGPTWDDLAGIDDDA